MCGIFGLSVNENLKPAQRGAFLTIIAFGNEKRGDDSWGFWTKNGKGGGAELIRGLGGFSKSIHKMFDTTHGFGHTRKATTGAVTVQNAHPFAIGNVVGAHNGMIANHEELNRSYGRNFEVDSMHLFAHINDGRPFDDIRGYGAIQWTYKNEPNTIYICRLSGGELSVRSLYGEDEEDLGVVWSSDDRHLKTAIDAIGLKSQEWAIDQGVIYIIRNGEFFKSDKTLKLGERYGSELNLDWRNGRNQSNFEKKTFASGTETKTQAEKVSNTRASSVAGSVISSGNMRYLNEWRAAEALRVAAQKKEQEKHNSIAVPASLTGRVNLDIAKDGNIQKVGDKWVEFMPTEGNWYQYDSADRSGKKMVTE